MISCQLELRNDTALFMHGTAGPHLVEVRPAAFRGAMRYWFRAVTGPFVALADLRRLEEELFGGAHGQQLTVRCRVRRMYKDISTKLRRPLPHKEQQPVEIAAIREGSGFELQLWRVAGGAQWECAQHALWLALHLGAFGQRARRGAGSLSITASDSGLLPALAPPLELGELRGRLEAGIRAARGAFLALARDSGLAVSAEPERRGFPVLRRGAVLVEALGAGSEEEQRQTLMLRLRDFKNPVFGLPLKLDGRWVGKGRWASPLWVRLTPLASGWAGVFTVLEPFPGVPGTDPQKLAAFLASGQEERQLLEV